MTPREEKEGNNGIERLGICPDEELNHLSLRRGGSAYLRISRIWILDNSRSPKLLIVTAKDK